MVKHENGPQTALESQNKSSLTPFSFSAFHDEKERFSDVFGSLAAKDKRTRIKEVLDNVYAAFNSRIFITCENAGYSAQVRKYNFAPQLWQPDIFVSCGTFFNDNDVDTQAAKLLHELTHLWGNTEDLAYYQNQQKYWYTDLKNPGDSKVDENGIKRENNATHYERLYLKYAKG